MSKFYVTFGSKYAHEPHPASPLINDKCYLQIEAEDRSAARERARALVGEAWAFLYDEAEFTDQPERYGLRCIREEVLANQPSVDTVLAMARGLWEAVRAVTEEFGTSTGLPLSEGVKRLPEWDGLNEIAQAAFWEVAKEPLSTLAGFAEGAAVLNRSMSN